MGARFRSWWKKIRKPLDTIIITLLVVIVVLVVVVILGYLFHWGWTGLSQKTLWDWLQLLIIPAVIALGGYLFTFTTSRNERDAADRHNQTEREIAQDNQREAALQEYIDKMSELLLHEKLGQSQPEDEVRKIAHVRILVTLPRLDEARKRSVLQFLYESRLIDKDKSIITLDGADLSRTYLNEFNLSEANLSRANLWMANLNRSMLSKANLSGANLSRASLSFTSLDGADLSTANLYFADLSASYLSGANLRGVDLSGADLSGAKLFMTNLSGVNLSGANLSGATINQEQLNQAKSLQGATMTDGSKHP